MSSSSSSDSSSSDTESTIYWVGGGEALHSNYDILPSNYDELHGSYDVLNRDMFHSNYDGLHGNRDLLHSNQGEVTVETTTQLLTRPSSYRTYSVENHDVTVGGVVTSSL